MENSTTPDNTISEINKRTGRNMPQAIATSLLLIGIIIGCLMINTETFLVLLLIFMSLALWELRVDFAVIGLHIPFVLLWICSIVTVSATYFAPWHVIAASLC
ncbi:MAG: phosphatidate cytidylyltransferase, partial [Bifidobacteriaceae bacterium]|nr:phosphatidate cytidylyltransferase [Bifidobacteriaceae bacterium]